MGKVSLIITGLLVGLAGCGPGYAVHRQSGSLGGANPIGIAFDYSGAIHNARIPEAQYVGSRSPDELAQYRMLQQQWQSMFAQQMATSSGRTIVPATGSEPVILTVRLERFILGRYVYEAGTATQVIARMSFSRQGEVTDEIGARCVRRAGPREPTNMRLAYCGEVLGRATGQFVLSQ